MCLRYSKLRNIKIEETRLLISSNENIGVALSYVIEGISVNGNTTPFDPRIRLESIESGTTTNIYYNISTAEGVCFIATLKFT